MITITETLFDFKNFYEFFTNMMKKIFLLNNIHTIIKISSERLVRFILRKQK